MAMKTRHGRETPITHLLILVIFVCLSIYTWKFFGCLGIPDCYLCRTLTPGMFINPLTISSSVDDFTKLINLKNFTFLINNFACNNTDDLPLIVVVHSDPYNYEKRLNIRSTWGKVISQKYKLLFMLGIPNVTAVQERIEEENVANADLVQGNFADTYRNLTYKHVMAFKWIKYYCPRTKYVLKTDDDVFVNLPRLLQYVSQNLPETKLMRCLPVYEGRAQRSWRSKWRVTWSEYKLRKYPPFCQGFAILYSSDVVMTLYAKAQIANYFWIDDVFISGFLALAANFTPSTFGKFMLVPQDLYRLMNNNCEDFPYLLGPWNLSILDIKKLWEKALKASQGHSSNRFSRQALYVDMTATNPSERKLKFSVGNRKCRRLAGITVRVKPKSPTDNYPLVMSNVVAEETVQSGPGSVAINGLDNQIAFGVEENPDGEAGLCGSILVFLSWVLIILTMPFSLFVCFKVVQEYERAVIFRLGRLLSGGAKGPGIFFILPCVDNYAKVDLRSSVFDIRPQEVLTKDSVTVSVDAVVYYRVCNATISVANVENAHHSTRLLAQTTLRNTMGTRLLSEILSERENISQVMQSALDDATVAWGIKVERVEIKDVRLPIQLQRAMAAEAEASREARAKVIAAEGEQKASRALREASEVIGDSPAALQLRYLQTLNTISAEKNSTIVFPLPIDILTYFMKANQAQQAQHQF